MDDFSNSNILIVDDEQDTLLALKRALRKEPYSCYFAHNAHEALEICQEHIIAVIATDLRMPGMSGLELLEELQKSNPDMVRLIQSGTDDIEMVISSINTGRIFRFIPKPLEPDAIKSILRDAIAYYRLQLEHKELTVLAEKQNRYLTKINDEMRTLTTRLRESEKRFRAMNDAAFDPIFLLDKVGAIVYANSAAERIFGFSQKEFLAMNLWGLVSQKHIEDDTIRSMLTSCNLQSHEWQLECISKTGQLINIGASIGFVTIGSTPHQVLIARDRTAEIQQEKQRLELEQIQLALESQIESRLLQSRIPKKLKGASISAFTLSAGHLNGDYSDLLVYDQEHIDILLGDVMGHGVVSALVSFGLKALYLKAIAQKSHRQELAEQAEIVQELQSQCIDDLLEINIFSTALFFRLDLRKRLVSIIDCGHTSSIHLHGDDGGSCTLLKGNNLPIGMVEQQQFELARFPIKHNDVIVLYSDGLTEARLPDDSLFGEERLVELVTKHHKESSEAILHNIKQALVSATGRDTFEDDASCIIIKIENNDA